MAPTNTLSDLLSPTYRTAEAALPAGAGVAVESRALSTTLAYDPASRSTPEPEVAPKRVAVPPRVLDRETGGQFVLGQNHPNPYWGETTVPFTLTNGGDVRLDLFDLAGRKVAGINRKGMRAGEHTIALNLSGLGLAAGQYVYQLQVTNSYGVYRQSKTMTAG